MTQPSPLASPEPWDLVCEGYVAELWDSFTHFADRAIERVGLGREMAVLDVAAGPGVVTLRVAPQVREVTSIDFSPAMTEELERRCQAAGLSNVRAHVGDAQSLPFAEGAFDRVISMFGVIFFPDRVAGLREMHRVLQPGGKAAVSSWVPFRRIPPLQLAFETLAQLMPELPFGKGKAPLGEPDEVRSELEAAGFRDVAVHEVSGHQRFEDATSFWASMVRSSAPFVMLRRRMGEAAWRELSDAMEAKLIERFGRGPVDMEPIALIGIGTRPSR